MADQLLTAVPVRNVTSAQFAPSSGASVLAARFQCLLSCGHIVIRPGEHVRGTRFSLRAPNSRVQPRPEGAHPWMTVAA